MGTWSIVTIKNHPFPPFPTFPYQAPVRLFLMMKETSCCQASMISLALLQEKFAELRTTYGFGTLFFPDQVQLWLDSTGKMTCPVGFNLNWSKNGTWRFHMVSLISTYIPKCWNELQCAVNPSPFLIWISLGVESMVKRDDLSTRATDHSTRIYQVYPSIFPTLRWSHFFVSPLTPLIHLGPQLVQSKSEGLCSVGKPESFLMLEPSASGSVYQPCIHGFPWFFYILYILYIWRQKGVRQLVVVIGLQVKIN